MLSRGLVNDEQLKKALKAQKDSGTGRVGEWLRHMGAVSEDQVTQILGLQWAIPVFPLERNRRFMDYAHLVPFPLLENAEMAPVHHTPINQMLSCHTEPCLAAQSHLQRALEELRRTPRGTEVLVVSGISERWDMVTAILDQLESMGATEVRVSGFDGFVWARLQHGSGYSDMLFRPHGG
jgi:predicted NAD/FAD-binding protein